MYRGLEGVVSNVARSEQRVPRPQLEQATYLRVAMQTMLLLPPCPLEQHVTESAASRPHVYELVALSQRSLIESPMFAW